MEFGFEPDDPHECPNCESTDLNALPAPDIPEMIDGSTTQIIVDMDCNDCGAHLEACFQYNSMNY